MPGPDSAYSVGIRILARRDHSTADLCGKLARRGFPLTDIEEAIERIKALGYLDDQRFASQWAESAVRNGKGVGSRLKMELLRRGVSSEITGITLTQLAQEHDEKALLAQLINRRFASFDPSTAGEKERLRVFSYLQRRGFSVSSILSYFNDSNT